MPKLKSMARLGLTSRQQFLGSGLIKPHPESSGGECDGSEEVSGELVVSCCDPSEVFELAKEALDEIAVSIDGAVDGALDFSVALGGDMSLAATQAYQVDQMLPVVTAISDDQRGHWAALQAVWARSPCPMPVPA